jgi:hypothetical protein
MTAALARPARAGPALSGLWLEPPHSRAAPGRVALRCRSRPGPGSRYGGLLAVAGLPAGKVVWALLEMT